jgi:hypothetical protein
MDSEKSASKGGSHPAHPDALRAGVRMFTIAMMAVSGWTLVHDYRRPDLNEWYAGLHRKGSSFGCCSKEDCHTTEAQLRDGVWWARIGKPVDHQDGSRDWILGNYVRIPDELIVKGDDGLPVRNPEGEAVLCHSIAWMNGNEIDPVNTTLFCFVPGPQS